MADSKITSLTSISTSTDPANDPLVIVDVSDTSMAATGTTKKVTLNQLLGASGIATLASATITGDLTVDTSTLKVDSANNRVGIGTASPAVALDVVGSAQFSGNLTMTTGSLNSQYWYGINATSMISSGSGSWPLLFGINGSEKARIDSSGNVGIGVTPSAWDTNYKALQLGYPNFISGNNGGNIIDIGVNAYFNTDWKYAASSVAATRYRQVVGVHQWFTAPSGTAGNAITWTQAMTLDASGNLLVGVTSPHLAGRSAFENNQTGQVTLRNSSATAGRSYYLGMDSGSAMQIANEVGVGVYMVYGGTSWIALSDERLKDIIEPISNAVAKVGSIRSVIGKFKTESEVTRRSFLIAQDVQAVLPEAVDASNPDRLGVSYTDVIPLLVAAIKELTARVQTLETR